MLMRPCVTSTVGQGGKGRGKGSIEEWNNCLRIYDLDENSISDFKGMPIYNAGAVAAAGIPVLHVCGNADQIVPIEENSYLIEDIFQDQNSMFKLIEKEGIGHHPHSLKDPAPIVRFILQNTDSSLIPARMNRATKRSVYFRSHCNNSKQIFSTTPEGDCSFFGRFDNVQSGLARLGDGLFAKQVSEHCF